MKEFMSFDFNVRRISLAEFVMEGSGKPLQRNRASHGLVLHLGGERIYRFSDGTVLQVKENEIIYLPLGSRYLVQNNRDDNCYFINFHLAEETSFPPFIQKLKNSQKVLPAFKEAYLAWKTKRPGYMMKCKEQLYHILYQMQKEYHTAYISNQKIELLAPAIKHILETYTTEPIRVDRLAGMCGITPEYFRALFHRYCGTSPVKYVNQLRIERAKELILSDAYTVSEAAAHSGFSDLCYFSKLFKKGTGVSPSEYGKEDNE